MRLKARVDSNQKEIVKAFRDLGWSVLILSQVGHGCPDIAIGKMGYTTLAEIKDGSLPRSRRKLTKDEEDFHREWLGSLIIVESVNDVIAYDRKFTKRHS